MAGNPIAPKVAGQKWGGVESRQGYVLCIG